jgi:REP element-mobilizing transposase RayT
MSTKYKALNPDSAYFVTITTVEWVDLFTRQNQRNLIVESLKFCQKEKGLEIFAWVLMASHLHMLCRSAKEEVPLSDVMRDFKKFTSKQIIKLIKEEPESRREWLLEMFSKACGHLSRAQEYKVWQDGYHAEELFTNKFIYQKLNYIHNNPVEAGIVLKPEDYLYSSARNYADLENLLEVELIAPQLRTY